MQKRLLVDMDGVMADVYAQLKKYEFEDRGIVQDDMDLVGKTEEEAFPNHDKYVNTKGFFETVPVMKDCVNVLYELNIKYEVYIVSSATEYPISLTDKMNWINHNFTYINWRQVVMCGVKFIINGDIMIDDHFKNLDVFPGETILYTQPQNMGKMEGRHKRVSSWKEIADILL